MTTSAKSQCEIRRCQWFKGQLGPLEFPTYVCDAFPLGIPEDIALGTNKHIEPISGDDGITFLVQPGDSNAL